MAQIPVHCDMWMRGDRYGVVRAVKCHRYSGDVYAREYWQVLLDKSNHLIWFAAMECRLAPTKPYR